MKSITREWLQKTIAEFETNCDEIPFGMDDDDAKILQVLKWMLESVDCAPAAEVISKYGDPEGFGERQLVLLTDIQKMPYGTKFYTGAPATDGRQVAELTMQVKRLAYSLRHAKPDSKLPDDAMAYLSRKGLISTTDVLR
ncbi:hypothetical protein [Enterobacter asburiae]|uniref:hypothetical protein n=1 Tax=Enterobacter asburiae TaxID=61645 RepID=UPI001CC0702B|nr:hypothetical protein [Enterobacter asburiae]UAN38758.1 hypothetical protein KGP18_23040 [Enterobacter asburiae]